MPKNTNKNVETSNRSNRKKKLTQDLLAEVLMEEKASQDFGFYWENIDQIFEQIRGECDEIKEAYDKQDKMHCKEEIGDLIHAAISVSFYCGFDPHQALEISFKKYQKRFKVLKELARADGFQDLKNQSTKILLDYWKKSKLLVKV